MATNRITSSFTSPSVTFYLDADVISTDVPNRRWLIRAYLRMSKGSGSYYNGSGTQTAYGNGGWVGAHTGSPFLPSGTTSWNSGPYDFWVNANSQGYWSGTSTTYPLQMNLTYGSINNTKAGSITLPRIGTVPPAPSPVSGTPDQITATTMRYQFSSNGDGGSTILRWEYQYSTTSDFSAGNSAWITSSGTSVITDLTPDTNYYLRSRGVNSIGTGPASTTSTGKTLTATEPGLAVVPQPSGTSAVVGLTPPAGMPSPSGYRVEYHVVGGSTTPITVATSPYTVTGLTAGETYEWRAAAMSGTYVGPFTAWETHVQPQPSFDAGYFDGSFDDRTDVTYSWDGTANNSTSSAFAYVPTGWGSHDDAGGRTTLTRVTGGHSGSFAAKFTFYMDATTSGASFGTANLVDPTIGGMPVAFGGSYSALIYANPSRPQRVQAVLRWYMAGGSTAGYTAGPAVVISPGVWTALRVPSSTPPVGAVTASVDVMDVEGDGWSLWRAGDSILLDDAIGPFSEYYFDGNTTDTAQYDYQWEGAVNASPSVRLASTTPTPDPLVDPDCPPVPAPPRPPAISDSCVEEDVLNWRQFWTEIAWTNVPEWTDAVPIMHIATTTAVRLVRIRYYMNPFRRPLEEIPSDSFCNEQIISYIPADTTITLDGVSTRVWADVSGRSDSLAADHLLYRGTDGVAIWPELGCGSGYYVTVDIPADSPQGSISVSYELVPRYM